MYCSVVFHELQSTDGTIRQYINLQTIERVTCGDVLNVRMDASDEGGSRD